jgi:ubiquinone/menaquinone biosynthesis C-methylase UbiE
MAKATTRQVQTLIGHYLKLYALKYNSSQPTDFNRYRDKWGFQAMADQFGYEVAKEIIEYYMQTPRFGHPVSQLLYNYEKIEKRMRERREDEEKRRLLREESMKRVERWRNGDS